MKIGVISDTHNNSALTKKALQIFKDEKVEMLIHAGDMDMAMTLDEFRDVGVPIKMALGNIDQEPELFVERAQELGLDFFLNAFIDLEVDDKRIYVFHGNVRGELSKVIDVLVESGKYDVVIYGHTHVVRNEVARGVLVLNPGSLKPLSVGVVPSVAVYDVDSGKVRIIDL